MEPIPLEILSNPKMMELNAKFGKNFWVSLLSTKALTFWAEWRIEFLTKKISAVYQMVLEKETVYRACKAQMEILENSIRKRREGENRKMRHEKEVFEKLHPRATLTSPIFQLDDKKSYDFELPDENSAWTSKWNSKLNTFSSKLEKMKLDGSEKEPDRNLLPHDYKSSPNLCIIQDTKFDLPEFNPGENLLLQSEEWSEYIRRFQLQCEFRNVSDPVRMKQALLIYGGKLVNDIDRFGAEPPSGSEVTILPYDNELTALIKKVHAHLGSSLGSNAVAKRHLFNTSKYDPNKTLSANLLHWEHLAIQAGIDKEERDSRIRDKLLEQHPDPTLTQKAMEHGWSLQEFKVKAASKEMSTAATNSIKNTALLPEKRVFGVQNSSQNKATRQVNQVKGDCPRCGRANCTQKVGCPAINAICHFCGKINHFARMCRMKANTNSKFQKTGLNNADNSRKDVPPNRGNNSKFITSQNRARRESGGDTDEKLAKLQARKDVYKSKYNKLKSASNERHNNKKLVKLTEIADESGVSSDSDISEISTSDD